MLHDAHKAGWQKSALTAHMAKATLMILTTTLINIMLVCLLAQLKNTSKAGKFQSTESLINSNSQGHDEGHDISKPSASNLAPLQATCCFKQEQSLFLYLSTCESLNKVCPSVV